MAGETDVVIVGAGAAGLSAAMECRRLGLQFQLLEGSHRIGGRAYSEEIAADTWFDLGCSYLHQGENNPFVAIADELEIPLGKNHGDMFADHRMRLARNGTELDASARKAYFTYADECFAAVEAAAARGDDTAVAELIDLEHEFALPFCGYYSDACATDLDLLSAIDFAAFAEGTDIPLAGGYGNLVAAWGAQVPVSLNTRVESIDWSGTRVKVTTPRGTLEAAAVICTVSTGILGAGQIAFNPGLPAWKKDAIQGLPMGTLNKIGVHFDTQVFDPGTRGFYLSWNDNGAVGGIEASVMGLDTAVVFCGGRQAVWLEDQGPAALSAFALERLGEVFGGDIRKRVTRTITTAWHGEPWTLGSYSAALPGSAHQRGQLARAVDRRLFFAGEATTVGDHCCAHGAYRSGRRAAREVAEVLNDRAPA